MLVEQPLVEVAQDRSELGLGGRPGQLVGMDEPVAAVGPLGRQLLGESGDDPRGEPQRVDELALCLARVDLDPADRDDRFDRAEALVLELAERRSVDCVRAARAESVDVEQRRTLADLLVRCERDAQPRPRKLGVRRQVRDRRHHDRHARLVVRAEERVAAAGDHIATDRLGELRHPRRVEPRAAPRQLDHAPVVVAVHERRDAAPRGVGARVEVGDQPDRGTLRVAIERRRHIAVGVQRHIGQPGFAQLGDQDPRELELAGRARGGGAIARRLRVDPHVAVESRQQFGRELGRQRGGERISIQDGCEYGANARLAGSWRGRPSVTKNEQRRTDSWRQTHRRGARLPPSAQRPRASETPPSAAHRPPARLPGRRVHRPLRRRATRAAQRSRRHEPQVVGSTRQPPGSAPSAVRPSALC